MQDIEVDDRLGFIYDGEEVASSPDNKLLKTIWGALCEPGKISKIIGKCESEDDDPLLQIVMKQSLTFSYEVSRGRFEALFYKICDDGNKGFVARTYDIDPGRFGSSDNELVKSYLI